MFQVAATLNGVSASPASQTIAPPASGGSSPTQTGGASHSSESFKPNGASLTLYRSGFTVFGHGGNGIGHVIFPIGVSISFAFAWMI